VVIDACRDMSRYQFSLSISTRCARKILAICAKQLDKGLLGSPAAIKVGLRVRGGARDRGAGHYHRQGNPVAGRNVWEPITASEFGCKGADRRRACKLVHGFRVGEFGGLIDDACQRDFGNVGASQSGRRSRICRDNDIRDADRRGARDLDRGIRGTGAAEVDTENTFRDAIRRDLAGCNFACCDTTRRQPAGVTTRRQPADDTTRRQPAGDTVEHDLVGRSWTRDTTSDTAEHDLAGRSWTRDTAEHDLVGRSWTRDTTSDTAEHDLAGCS
jgi:hypothetical protein